MKKLFTLFALCFLITSCDSDKTRENTIEETATVPVMVLPELPPLEIKPQPSEPPVPPVADKNAGKVSLWKRTSGYDAAVFLPVKYDSDPRKLYPMILSLHGLNGSVLNIDHTAVGGKRTGFINQVWDTPLAKTYPAIVIAPDESPIGTTTTSLWKHDKLRALILAALKKYKIDPERVVVTGLSAGSIASQELVKYSKDLIAAAMPGAYKDILAANPCLLADIPVWVFGNDSDSLFGASGWKSTAPTVRSCSNYIHEFTLTVYRNDCGHGCWDYHWAKPDVQRWLIEQKK